VISPQEGLSLIIVAHDDAYLPVVRLSDGWGDACQKRAAVVRLARGDLERLGLKENARVEITGPAGSVVVAARTDATGAAGTGLMPTSLYTNSLAGLGPDFAVLPRRHIEARAAATAKDITPVRDLIVRRNRA
jgi:formylmethanofuran dehydrogenase subunit D